MYLVACTQLIHPPGPRAFPPSTSINGTSINGSISSKVTGRSLFEGSSGAVTALSDVDGVITIGFDIWPSTT